MSVKLEKALIKAIREKKLHKIDDILSNGEYTPTPFSSGTIFNPFGSAIEAALYFPNLEVIDKLNNYGLNLKEYDVTDEKDGDSEKNDSLSLLLAHKQIEAANYFLDNDIFIEDNLGDCLSLASKANDLGLVKKIINLDKAKEAINSPYRNGNTPLYYAAINKNKEIAKLLLDNGALAEHVVAKLNIDRKNEAFGFLRLLIEKIESKPEIVIGGFIKEGDHIVSDQRETRGIKITTEFNFKAKTITTISNDNGVGSTFIRNFKDMECQGEIEQASVFLTEEGGDIKGWVSPIKRNTSQLGIERKTCQKN